MRSLQRVKPAGHPVPRTSQSRSASSAASTDRLRHAAAVGKPDDKRMTNAPERAISPRSHAPLEPLPAAVASALDSPRYRDSPPLGGVHEHAAFVAADADLPHDRCVLSHPRRDEKEVFVYPQDPDLRYDVARRRAVAGHRPAAAREGGDRRAARAPRRGRDRGRLRGRVAGRLRRRPGRRRGRRRAPPSPRSPARTREDIDAAVEALAGAGRSRIHIVLGTSPIHMEKKLGLEPERGRSSRRAGRSSYAPALVDEVEFSCEDATRSDPDVRRARLPRRDPRRRDGRQPARHRRLRAARAVRRVHRRGPAPLPRAAHA